MSKTSTYNLFLFVGVTLLCRVVAVLPVSPLTHPLLKRGTMKMCRMLGVWWL